MVNTLNSSLDQVILVDLDDREIGVMDKVAAHRGAAQLHRASSVFLFNTRGQLLMQQRSAEKILCQLQWANTCCGNVRPGESYEECAVRRLREELGITGVAVQPAHKFSYFAQCDAEFSEREMDQVFLGRYDGEVHPNPHEVAAFAWEELSPAELTKKYTLVPWLPIVFAHKKLMTMIQDFLKG